MKVKNNKMRKKQQIIILIISIIKISSKIMDMEDIKKVTLTSIKIGKTLITTIITLDLNKKRTISYGKMLKMLKILVFLLLINSFNSKILLNVILEKNLMMMFLLCLIQLLKTKVKIKILTSMIINQSNLISMHSAYQ